MDSDKILEELEALLADLSIELRYEQGDFSGGYYKYRDIAQIVLNKNLTMEKKIHIIASELKSNLDLEGVYLVPALREVIENAGSMV